MSDSSLSPYTTLSKQSGFTMLELVIVVAIMAIVAGSAIMSFGNTASDAQLQTTRYSMKQIAQAVEAFYSDNKNISVVFPPNRVTPADLDFLFNKVDVSEAEWSVDYRQGWRGPYLKQAQYMYVDIGDDLKTNGSGYPQIIDSNPHEAILAIPDSYEHYPVVDGVSKSFNDCPVINTSDCLFEWYSQASNADTRINKMGRPFLLFDLDFMNSRIPGDGIPRIVSLGPNGIYEPMSCDRSIDGDCTRDKLCGSSGDDLVLCLR
ncbi:MULTISPECIES: type II secretion system protein [unclassified Methylophaga]|nr:type II secretion system protein [Methylophaga sp. UBA2513]|tara:strand:- start:74428 stop:75213 length:786 start_codon:yes stop_codon:yes gene_type:complete